MRAHENTRESVAVFSTAPFLRTQLEAKMDEKNDVALIAATQVTMNRWVDPNSARGLVWVILMNARSACLNIFPDPNERSSNHRTEQEKPILYIPQEILTSHIPRFLHFDVPLPGMIYIFGGRASKVLEPEYYLDTAECFDTFRNEWIRLPSMSTKRVGAASVAASNGLIYIIGGYSKHPDKPLATGECFNPKTGEWKAIAPMSKSRFGHTAQEFGQYIFVVGGDSRRNLVTEIERYDIIKNSWTTISMLPRPVAGGRILARENKLYLVGGDIGSQPLSFTDVIRVYDPIQNSWGVLEQKLTMGRSACAVAWCGATSSEIAVIGGYAAENDGFFELDSTELIQTVPGYPTQKRCIPPLPEARAGCRAVTIGDKIYVIGGESPVSDEVGFTNRTQAIEDSILSGLFNPSTASSSRSLTHVRDMLLHALQQRIPISSAERSLNSEDDTNARTQRVRIPTVSQADRRPHPNVAIFDTVKWGWETDTPVMATARTAASVCVGPGYSASFGWNTLQRWVTESSPTSVTPRTDTSFSGSRPLASDG
jgi:hypothetical protein